MTEFVLTGGFYGSDEEYDVLGFFDTEKEAKTAYTARVVEGLDADGTEILVDYDFYQIAEVPYKSMRRQVMETA
jgi:hypothetical protein